jgi:hypothetical protein
MPITFVFSCFALFGLLLLVPAVPIAVVCLARKKKRKALTVLCIPGGMIALAVLLPLVLFVLAERHNRLMSAQPDRLFEMTFAFWPPSQAEVLEGYYELAVDSLEKDLQFRAPQEVIDRICGQRFIACDRGTFVTAYGGEWNHLPDKVRSWFLPAVEQADCFYIAEPFDDSFRTYNRALLCYNRQTGVTCFHWMGGD